ncbi:hypothetical protein KL938_004808 [Ogataea parapolymorpha]|nr:hypothetical protein KL938_004808 [Ogataea parapolymorpha]
MHEHQREQYPIADPSMPGKTKMFGMKESTGTCGCIMMFTAQAGFQSHNFACIVFNDSGGLRIMSAAFLVKHSLENFVSASLVVNTPYKGILGARLVPHHLLSDRQNPWWSCRISASSSATGPTTRIGFCPALITSRQLSDMVMFSSAAPVTSSKRVSATPYTICPILAQYADPAHIQHGSKVVYRVQFHRNSGPNLRYASLHSVDSAWFKVSTLPCSKSTSSCGPTRMHPNGCRPSALAL